MYIPRSGKSTLVRHAFPEHSYVSLEDLDQREFTESDPRGFLSRLAGGAILDEVQRCQ
ncbi:ATPase [hydrothermal vent metagenome]|uniref:ATPase n=1 Tax=hydrothermal vent metagenome TaxID=652676 RepID=A0A3B0YV86_9ZZZZ